MSTRTKHTAALLAAVADEYNAGSSQAQVAAKLGMTRKAIEHLMARHGLGSRPRRKKTFSGSGTSLRNVPEYHIWRMMIYRCTDPSRAGYARYGGRGIKICERWLESFDSFMADMGPRPTTSHTLDRADNDGDYEPSNCRWATWRVQILNCSRTRPVATDRGEYFPSRRAAHEQMGANPQKVRQAVECGGEYMGRRWSDAPLIGMVSPSGEYAP